MTYRKGEILVTVSISADRDFLSCLVSSSWWSIFAPAVAVTISLSVVTWIDPRNVDWMILALGGSLSFCWAFFFFFFFSGRCSWGGSNPRCNSFKNHDKKSILSFWIPITNRLLLALEISCTSSCGLIYRKSIYFISFWRTFEWNQCVSIVRTVFLKFVRLHIFRTISPKRKTSSEVQKDV